MKIEDDWLIADKPGERVHRVQTARTYALDVPEPVGEIWHTTDSLGTSDDDAFGLAADIVHYRPDDPRSWHWLIAKSGLIYQSAPFDVGTWHVGKSGVIDGRPWRNVNRVAVGCEIQNAGRVHKDALSGAFFWIAPDKSRHAIDAARVARVDTPGWEGWWDKITPEQEHSAALALRAQRSRYGWQSGQAMFGHVHFAYPAKEDPGPLWLHDSLGRVLAEAFG